MRAIRHLPTDARVGEFNGWRDVDIHKDWQCEPYPIDAQMQRTVSSLISTPPVRIFCSPLMRAQKTAKLLLALTRLSIPVITAESLKELHFGLWEGLTWSEIEEKYPLEAKNWTMNWIDQSPPQGESLLDLEKRLAHFFSEYRPSSSDVVVCHAGVIKVLLALEAGNRQALQLPVPYHSLHAIDLERIRNKSL